jgi:hypothetical protein
MRLPKLILNMLLLIGSDFLLAQMETLASQSTRSAMTERGILGWSVTIGHGEAHRKLWSVERVHIMYYFCSGAVRCGEVK